MNTSLSEATSLSAMPASSASRGLCPSGSARPMSLTALDQEQEPDGTGRETMAMIEAGQDVLILKRASASRSSGQWSDDDFDVLWHPRAAGVARPQEHPAHGALHRAGPRQV